MPAGAYRFQVGSIGCAVLADGYGSYPATWFFPNADPQRLALALEERRLPLDAILSPYACLLIQTGRRVILVDAGAGESSPTTGAIRARLEAEGIRAGDVDTVILSHAHPDHIGGAVDPRGRPVFPNARYVLSEIEMEFWTEGRPGLGELRVPPDVKRRIETTARRCLEALRFHLEPVDGEREICPGVRTIPAPGHTAGHLAIVVESGGERLLNMCDAALHPLHLAQPEWENGFDVAPQQAVATRRALAGRAAADNMRLMAFHFPFPSVGRAAPRQDGGWDWEPGW
ncbi:MAG: MBL fold metallo-hydrolase [Bryobacteraceae bacterium]|jgi:glyoxylase-like metal-dependent hydrolase (beta-lactamase superfamily II)